MGSREPQREVAACSSSATNDKYPRVFSFGRIGTMFNPPPFIDQDTKTFLTLVGTISVCKGHWHYVSSVWTRWKSESSRRRARIARAAAVRTQWSARLPSEDDDPESAGNKFSNFKFSEISFNPGKNLV